MLQPSFAAIIFSMNTFLTVLLVLALLGVLVVLGMGIFGLVRGGNPRLSNKMMAELRVMMQGAALLILALLMLLAAGGHADPMVRLTRIYTRGGDKGETSLGDGSRVAKQALRVEAYGTVDEANAGDRPGAAALPMPRPTRCWPASRTICSISAPISARPEEEKPSGRRVAHRRGADRAARARDRRDERRPCAAQLVHPARAAAPAAAYLHLARTVTRRAERLVCALAAEEPVNPEAVKYLNRLSDHLFVLGRGSTTMAPGRAVETWRHALRRRAQWR